jgi:hypothetical protein
MDAIAALNEPALNDIRLPPLSPTPKKLFDFGECRLPLCLISRIGYTAFSQLQLGDGISGGIWF